MSSDNSTITDFPTVAVNKLALDILQDAATFNAAGTVVQILLSSLSFGAFTILGFASIYFLISKGSAAQTNGRILLLSIVLLYTSTATYMAAFIWAWSDRNHLILKAVDGLSSSSYDGQDAIAALEHVIHRQSLMITLALGGNLVIGDAIVWWRACVIWQHKMVNCIGLLVLTLTAVFGIIGIARSHDLQTTSLAFLYQGSYGLVSELLSFCTNILATSLIAYKAWKHRRLIKRHFAAGGTTSQVLKAFALLVESGCVYCIILIFALMYHGAPTTSSSRASSTQAFRTVTTDFSYGCFVPLVAIYPTIIIVLVALKRSPIDRAGLSQAHQAHGGHGSETAEGGTSSTLVFHHSTFRSSTSVRTEGVGGGGIPASDPGAESADTGSRRQ